MAKVGKGIEVINLNLAISLVLPKNCSAHLSNYWMNRRPTDVLSNYGLKQSPTESEVLSNYGVRTHQLSKK